MTLSFMQLIITTDVSHIKSPAWWGASLAVTIPPPKKKKTWLGTNNDHPIVEYKLNAQYEV